MNLSSEMKTVFVNELKLVVENMRKSKTIPEKMYYFSASFGMAQRIFNIEYDPELNFIHNVIHASYGFINNTLQTISKGQSIPTLPPELFPRIEESIDELIALIEADQPIYQTLQKISNLGFSASGNGYYLYQKGMIEF